MKEIGIGVIGAGYIGQLHAGIYSKMPGVKLLGVCDVDLAKAEACAHSFHCRAFDSSEALLRLEGLDGVSVCTPDGLHKAPALDACKQKKHILLEKPIADTMEDAQAISMAVAQSGVHCVIGLVERFHKPFIRAKEAVEAGAIGEPVSLRSQRFNSESASIRVARRDSIISFLGVHDLDLLLWFGGPIERISAEAGCKMYGNPEIEDTAMILARFANGCIGLSQLTWGLDNSAPFRASAKLEIIGTKGIIEVNTLDDSLIVASQNGYTYPLGFDRTAAFESELLHFINCIRGVENPRVSTQDGVRSLAAALQARQSCRR